MTKIEMIKMHFRENKSLYMGLVVGVSVGIVISKHLRGSIPNVSGMTFENLGEAV